MEVNVNPDAIAKSLGSMLTDLLKQDMSDPELNLMDCGLTSLMAMQVIARIRDLYAVELPIMALFEMDTGTVSGLARYIAISRECQAPATQAESGTQELVL